MNITKTDIVNALRAVSSNHILTTADQIYDEGYGTEGEYQDVINQKMLANVSAETSARTVAIEALAEQVDEEYAKKDGTYSTLTAGFADELVGNTSDKRQDTKKYIIRTTAGDLDVRSDEPMSLVDVKGLLNGNCEPWVGTAFRFNGFNAIIPTQVINGVTISNNKIVSGSNKIVYFRSVFCEWGEYGTSEKNNGYTFTSSNGEAYIPVAVALSEDIPSNGTSLIAVPTHTEHSHTYYLPTVNAGYLCVEIPSSVNPSEICGHIAWSNKMDDVFEARTASTIDLTSYRNSIHSWGMAGIKQNNVGAYDEIVIELVDKGVSNVEWYRRIERTGLASAALQWEMQTVTSTGSDTVSYIFTATLSGMKQNGLVRSSFSDDIISSGGTIVYTSNTISTVTALREAFGSAYLYYEMATPVSGTSTAYATVYGDDMGTEEVLGAEDANAYITTAYVVGLKDYIRGLPSELATYNSVITNHILRVESDVETLFNYFNNNIGNVTAESLDLTDISLKVMGFNYWASGKGTPTETETGTYYPFREYFDETNRHFYKGTGTTQTAWVEMIDRPSLNAALTPYKAASATTEQINTAITNAIDELDYTDTSVDNQYVTKVSESNGKITVERGFIQVNCGTY